MSTHLSNYINGSWLPGSGAQFSVVNPANGQTIWQANEAGVDEVSQACRAARASFRPGQKLAWTNVLPFAASSAIY